jgi:hypothetical protein
MMKRLGFGWGISLLGFIALVLLPVPWVIFKWGPTLRARSQYIRQVEDAAQAQV